MFDNSVSNAMLEKALSGTWQRVQITMNNIANEDTPGYKAKRVEFESLLRQEVNARTNVTAFDKLGEIGRIRSASPYVYEDNGTVGRADGNNVDADSEQIELARTQIHYNALVQKISGHYSTLQYVITGR